MAELKTKLNSASVEDFLDSIENKKSRTDSYTILKLFKEITGKEAKMWGNAIVGFGSYKFKYKSGREGEWMQLGFSPRKQALTVYIMSGFSKLDKYLAEIGKVKSSKSCLYIKKIEDVNLEILSDLVRESLQLLQEKQA